MLYVKTHATLSPLLQVNLFIKFDPLLAFLLSFNCFIARCDVNILKFYEGWIPQWNLSPLAESNLAYYRYSSLK